MAAAASLRRALVDPDGGAERVLELAEEVGEHGLAQETDPPDFDVGELTLPVSLPSELVRHRPDILAAEAQLHAEIAVSAVASSLATIDFLKYHLLESSS